ncbi:uncharacterized protein LOC131157732 [Malania oleifera]|uniref:uncharacterized protein LOC131157732 n=1 Tax=Malania oleifera TaxID=397392 RepID=UPI0025AEC0FE|nr:uncharacterized protein LOC131157732 [Malania oleifera]
MLTVFAVQPPANHRGRPHPIPTLINSKSTPSIPNNSPATPLHFPKSHTRPSPATASGMATSRSKQDERAGAEIVRGAEECYRHSVELLEELGFPRGVLPLRNLEECGRVRETGFVWMKQTAPYEHFFEGTKTRVSYAVEVTGYVERLRMKRMTGVKSKQVMLWVPITEMSVEEPARRRIHFKTPVGLGRAFPVTAFMTEEEKKKYLETANE